MTIDQALKEAGTKYRKDILAAYVLGLDRVLPHFKLRTGIQGKETGGALSVDAQFVPYKKSKNPTDTAEIVPFEWETYLGDLLEEFDPHEVMGTLYTERTASKPDQMQIARLTAINIMKGAGAKLRKVLFTAERNAAGNKSKDLFNGFSTLFAAAVAANKVGESEGNYVDKSAEPLDENNIGDVLKRIWRDNLTDELKDQDVKLYCGTKIADMYKDWFQFEYPNVRWNEGYEQRKLHCSDGACSIVPLSNMNGQDYMFFGVKENMLIGVDQMSDAETCEIRRGDNPKLTQIYAKTYFGVGFDNLMPEYICGVKVELA